MDTTNRLHLNVIQETGENRTQAARLFDCDRIEGHFAPKVG
jgi:hypothetical protein